MGLLQVERVLRDAVEPTTSARIAATSAGPSNAAHGSATPADAALTPASAAKFTTATRMVRQWHHGQWPSLGAKALLRRFMPGMHWEGLQCQPGRQCHRPNPRQAVLPGQYPRCQRHVPQQGEDWLLGPPVVQSTYGTRSPECASSQSLRTTVPPLVTPACSIASHAVHSACPDAGTPHCPLFCVAKVVC